VPQQVQLLENEITRLSGMRSEQRKLRNNKFAAKKAMGPALANLQIWLADTYDAFSLLDEPTRLLAEGAQAWSVGESPQMHVHTYKPVLSSHTAVPPHAVQINFAWAITPG
jgi:hypothetical protein